MFRVRISGGWSSQDHVYGTVQHVWHAASRVAMQCYSELLLPMNTQRGPTAAFF